VRAYESDGHFLILRRYVSDIPRVEKYIRSVQPACTSVRCVATEVASFRTRKMRYMRREPGGKPRADEMIALIKMSFLTSARDGTVAARTSSRLKY
jgi:hypothetical protein